jgi:two-component system chemotaxis response regulator CheB
MPAFMTQLFAERLDADCALKVREARDGDWVEPGSVLLAPGDYHMSLQREAGRYRVALDQTPKVWFQRPAVDVLFQSAVATAGKHALGVLLTGMGRDGAEGLLELKQAGAYTITQDEATCAVYGMPKVAYEIGASREVKPIDEIPGAILRGLHQAAR